MRSRKDAVGVALQVAYEYPEWGCEHVSEMLDTYESSGDVPPCDYDELMNLTMEAAKHKKQGRTFNEAEKLMMSTRR